MTPAERTEAIKIASNSGFSKAERGYAALERQEQTKANTTTKTWKIAIQDALNWQLDSTCLSFALADAAEEALDLVEEECTAVITVVGEEFVVTLDLLTCR